MVIEQEKKTEYIQNTKDVFKDFFKSKEYEINEDVQQIKVVYKGHKIILEQNIPKEEYLMGISAGWTLTNSKDESKHTIALSIRKNSDEYICKYKLICDTNWTIKYPDFENMQELLQCLFKDLQ